VLRISISRKRCSLNLQEIFPFPAFLTFNSIIERKGQGPSCVKQGEIIFLGSNFVWACQDSIRVWSLFSFFIIITFVPYNQRTTLSHFAGWTLVILSVDRSSSSSISTYLLFRGLLEHFIDFRSKELSLTESQFLAEFPWNFIKCNCWILVFCIYRRTSFEPIRQERRRKESKKENKEM
jgi:hypothetical protein